MRFSTDPQICRQPVELLRNLLRFDTTNPPGNERPCQEYIAELLRRGGLHVQMPGATRERPCVVARLPGRGEAPPLLLQGHVDVVPTAGQPWSRDPFGAEVVDDWVYGRGALDMKGGVAMFLAAVLRARDEGLVPAGDVIVALLPDEEAGGAMGSQWLCEHHPELFAGVRYALGEFGGFTLDVWGRRVYPVMVAEKQVCWLRAHLRGDAGHASLPTRGGLAARLGRLLVGLDEQQPPITRNPVAEQMVESLAAHLGSRASRLRQIFESEHTRDVVQELGPVGRIFEAALRHTVNATVISAGQKVNVLPGEAEVQLDVRLLPGTPWEAVRPEIQRLLGSDVALEGMHIDTPARPPDMSLFPQLGTILKESDPEAVVVPYLFSGATDGRFFARLGIQTYGFIPCPLPAGVDFAQLIHTADERIPVSALEFGTKCLFRFLSVHAHGAANGPEFA